MHGMFWMVLADNSSQTTVRHDTRDRAQNEARRLASANPGIRFFVLQSIGAAIRHEPISWEAHQEQSQSANASYEIEDDDDSGRPF